MSVPHAGPIGGPPKHGGVGGTAVAPVARPGEDATAKTTTPAIAVAIAARVLFISQSLSSVTRAVMATANALATFAPFSTICQVTTTNERCRRANYVFNKNK